MAEGDKARSTKQQDMNKFLLVTIASIVIIFVVFACVNYIIMENLITKKLEAMNISQEDLLDEDSEDELQKGLVVDLGDFILNLCDENQKKYLKVNVAIEVTRKDTDLPLFGPKKGRRYGAYGVVLPPIEPSEFIQKEMYQYKPAIRDAIITNLSSKTSTELATAAGKELAKEQITNDINLILGGEREVLRVSFGQFIIQ